MNKELKGRIFDVPQDILDKINHTIAGLNGENGIATGRIYYMNLSQTGSVSPYYNLSETPTKSKKTFER